MSTEKIEAHKITKPIQLMAVWFIALLLVESAFLTAAAKIPDPSWVCPTLVISAISFVPLFLLGIFLMQTVFRKELQEDQYYSEWLQRHELAFLGFNPENIETKRIEAHESDLESNRIKKYEANRGLFLVHSWRPSLADGQVADIVIWIHQHGTGPLNQNTIEKVEYELGPKFFDEPMVKTNSEDHFRLEVSAYGPMLCIARVYFRDSSPSIILERYIDINEPPNIRVQRTRFPRR